MSTITSTTESPQQQAISSNVIIAGSSLLFILILIYPWIIAVTVISFVIGFTCLEHADRFIKASILSGRFGQQIQSRFKEYITVEEESKVVSKQEVIEDPLREYLEEKEQKASIENQQQQQQQQQEAALAQVIQNTLLIPGRGSSASNRSSPEKVKTLLDSPARSLSAASSRRVSEDIPSSLVTHHNNKTPSPSRSIGGASTPSPSKTLKSEVAALKVDQELRVDVRVDKSFGRLCTNIINYYISSSWAPYETRRQLKLSFKQLLTSVAEQFNKKLVLIKDDSLTSEEGYPHVVRIAREKLVPLILHYTDKTISRGTVTTNSGDVSPIISPESKNRLVLKIRKFCRKIFERFLAKDDQNCKLWMELCVAVLADGVLVNVMNLGKDKIPELLEEIVKDFKNSRAEAQKRKTSSPPIPLTPRKSIATPELEERFLDPLTSENFMEAQAQIQSDHDDHQLSKGKESLYPGEIEVAMQPTEPKSTATDRVPFLLNSFLDPPFNMEKPDQVVSRWRPTLLDIISETDLLYPLIQYMKHVGGQQSLAYLQGVLDAFPDEGDPYCKRVLELEYLPGFCRSSLLLETLGLNRVEVALDIGASDPFSLRRGSSGSGHTRSASYGGPSSSSFREFLKLEQGIVDGLPLAESSHHNQINLAGVGTGAENEVGVAGNNGNHSNNATLPGAGAIEPSLAFKRRPHLEMYIAKFMKSTTKSWKQYYDPLAEKCGSAKRAGIDAKSYEEWNHPEVNSRVVIKASTGDIYDIIIQIVTSLMRNGPIASPFCSGLANFVKPYLMPVFVSQLEKNLSQILSTDLLVTVLDLIADVYEEPAEDSDNDEGKTGNSDDDYEGHRKTESSRPSNLPTDHHTINEEDSQHHHNSSCTTCDPSLTSTIKSFLEYLLESFVINFIDLEHLVKSFKQNRDYIFLFFVDVLDVIMSEIVEE